MKTTLIISTYNWPEALELVLISVYNQSVLPNEIIIADDGSTEETKNLIDSFKKLFSDKLIHVWHEDKGFRKCEIINKALKLAHNEYIIQIDGDIIIHKKFIENHIYFAKPHRFITGSRTFLNNIETQKAFKEKKITFSIFNKNLKNKFNGFYAPFLAKLFTLKKYNLNKIRSCNISFWKSDIFKVNGYNEDMVGWGLEDTELAIRFLNSGVSNTQIKFSAIEYHLEHKKATREMFNVNNQILQNTIKKALKVTINGIHKP